MLCLQPIHFHMSTEHKASGHFIVIEGPDGSGKTTQMLRLKTRLEMAGHEVVIAREPGGTPQGQKIRQLFLDGQGELAPMAEVMLLLAAKAQLLKEVIYPAYNTGKIVLMDRYSDSLLAYQGGGRQLGFRVLRDTLRASELNFPPTMTLFIDTPLDVCAGRILARNVSENNSIDALGVKYHQRVHNAYKEIADDAEMTGRPYAVINGNQAPANVFIDILAALEPTLPTIYRNTPGRAVLVEEMRD